MSSIEDGLTEASPNEKGVSTAASGPAGAHFEQEVAASYLLAMLCGAPPRGMPGTRIETVKLQQGNSGYPLDDVIVGVIDAAGQQKSLEIQVKRTITFSPKDDVFAKAAGQIAETGQTERFKSSTVEMAIAVSRGTSKIEGEYQDLLALARQVDSGTTFARDIGMRGVGNPNMRQFVKTFTGHLRANKVPCDVEPVWQHLRRLQILIFDFEAPGSASRDLARERCRAALAPEDVSKADALWAALTVISFDAAKRGGILDRLKLLEELKPYELKLAGERRHLEARRALAEASGEALAAINVRVGDVQLARLHWTEQVRAALGGGRYVEIRGEPGVGKSGVLRQMAELALLEGQVIVLNPVRCPSQGGSAFCAHIGFQGNPRELLAELAADGGVTLFIDNLDFYDKGAQATVADLIRAAAGTAGVSVIATARPTFGVDDADWLPADAICALKRSKAVVIADLSEGERDELRDKAPALAPLLAPEHPARKVSGNLFRLDRLSRRSAAEQAIRTEVELADLWWSLGDGIKDAGLRERCRLLSSMGQQALRNTEAYDSTSAPPPAVEALVASGTLREVQRDSLAFQHDVLREWAIGFTLYEDPTLVDSLPLDKMTSAAMARGIELAARLSLERTQNDEKWRALLKQVSRPGVHRAWRRYALLALIRSEAADSLLPRAQPALLSEGAELLKELVGTVSTVEVKSMAEVLAGQAVELNAFQSTVRVPRGDGWHSLIAWLLKLGPSLPAAAIPDVVKLYVVYLYGTLGLGPLVSAITHQIGIWLRDFEPQDKRSWRDPPRPTLVDWTGLGQEERRHLRQDLHDNFLALGQRAPELAQAYLRALIDDIDSNQTLAEELVRQPFNVMLAAPSEFAELVAMALIESSQSDDDEMRRGRDEPFTFLDSNFIPISPAQGPFFRLLTHQPSVGLGLVHRLVSHSIAWITRGKDAGNNRLVLRIGGVEREFPWTWSYQFSRETNFYAMSSGLQALAAWAHRRVDAGEPFEAVLTDVLGPPGSCAAYVLIAVDLVLSHWPASRANALPFLESPELLSMDVDRASRDLIAGRTKFNAAELFGFDGLPSEPKGEVSSAELRNRPSHGMRLSELIDEFIASSSPEEGRQLADALLAAATRLGPYRAHHTFADPPFMVRHALNRADISNRKNVEITQKDGSRILMPCYVSPAEEEKHLSALRAVRAAENESQNIRLALGEVLRSSSRLGPGQLELAIQWAREPERHPGAGATPIKDAVNDDRMAALTVAMLVVRDAQADLREKNAEWARGCFDAVLRESDRDGVLQIREGLGFNPLATSFAGCLFALRHRAIPADIEYVLMVAARGIHEVAHGLGSAIDAVMEIDPRVVRSLIRCALHGCTSWRRRWNIKPEKEAELKAEQGKLAKQAVDAELQWLAGAGAEPVWPMPPHKEPRTRSGIHLPKLPAVGQKIITMEEALFSEDDDDPEIPFNLFDDEDEIDPPWFNSQAAALWLRQLNSTPVEQLPWLAEMVEAYIPWTMVANGAELSQGEEASDPPGEWNQMFFDVLVRVLPHEDLPKALSWIGSLFKLGDRNFFDLTAILTGALDESYFGPARRPSSTVAVGIREALANHLVATWGWRRAQGKKDSFSELHLGQAVSGMFFNAQGFGRMPSRCYLKAHHIDRLRDFLPVLDKLVAAGPSLKVADVLLNLLAVSPRGEHLPLLVAACRRWLEAFAGFPIFWVDFGIGNRWCKLVHAAIGSNDAAPDASLVDDLTHLVSELVALGVAEAARLETTLDGP
jgi:hypothetical protein